MIQPRSNRDRRISPPRIDKHPIQNIYQEIDSTSTDDDRTSTRNSDLQFIRGAIDRVFQFNNRSTTDVTSESSSHYEEVKDSNRRPYPAVEAVQRFYHHKNQPNTEKVSSLRENSTKTSEYERVSSEEIDDTFNDIDEVDYQNGKFNRRLPVNHSSDNRRTTQKTSQETQTVGRVCQHVTSISFENTIQGIVRK